MAAISSFASPDGFTNSTKDQWKPVWFSLIYIGSNQNNILKKRWQMANNDSTNQMSEIKIGEAILRTEG